MLRQLKNLVTSSFPVGSRKIYHTINNAFYKGVKYYCPICGKGYKRFLPGPDKIKSNSKCPGCSSLERHRLLWLYLVNERKILDSKIKLLNIAPDYATQNKIKKLVNIDYTSVDLESSLAMKKADLTNLPFVNNMFDAIICYHVLEHIEDDLKAMSELFRVLKQGGWAILQSPIDDEREETFEDYIITSPQERKKIFGQEDHVRIYGKDYFIRLRTAGFDVTEDAFIRKFSQSEIEKFVLYKEEKICFCTKPVN
jgi:SAM-dependent methyltransferase